jgi:3,4-dehydroadipyl-CoA semialdehyde dehydrogenase
MTELLLNHLGGRWVAGQGAGSPLFDPVLGDELVRVDATGLDLRAGFAFARDTGGAALRSLTYRQRAALLAAAVKVLQAHRADYEAIATANSGTVKSDSSVDIDGGIYTLSTYARMGEGLGDARHLADGDAVRLAKDALFQGRHVLVPSRGLALFINAFNFPSWGLWEKAAPALLSGVPVVVKPATATAWLTQRMVRDVVDAGVLPPGALSVVCGSGAGLMDALEPFDVVSFTGSADTAALIRSHAAVTQRSVRVNIEADSVNSALLLPGETPGGEAFDLLAREVAREMTQKSGQKCTAIRRVFVPEACYASAAEAIGARLARTPVGNPRNETVRMGALVSRAQLDSVRQGLARLQQQAETLHDGARTPWWTPTRRAPAASAPRCWARAAPTAATPAAWSTTSRCSAPWPRWCPTATPPTRWHWWRAARARWWRRCSAATRARWPTRRSIWPRCTAACMWSAPTSPQCTPATAT